MFNRPSDNRSDNNIVTITISAIFTILISAYITYSYFKTRANKKLKSIHIPTNRITQATVLPKQIADEKCSASSAIHAPIKPIRRSPIVSRKKNESNEKGFSAVGASSTKSESTSSSSSQLFASSSFSEAKVKTPRKGKEKVESAKTLAIRFVM